MIELTIIHVAQWMAGKLILGAGIYLTSDIVDTSHSLPFETTEKVSQTGSGTGVLVVILHHMTDVFHAMLPTPLADLLGKIFFHQTTDAVHENVAHLCG